MIELPAGARIWIAAGVTDMRRGFTGLSAQVQTALEQERSPVTSSSFAVVAGPGQAVVVRRRRLCLFAKRLERGRFIWPKAESGTVSLTRRSCRCY